MNRKLFAAVLVLSVALSTAGSVPRALAATPPTTQGSGQRREALERFKAALEQLDLTQAQKEKIKSIFFEAKEKLEALKSQTVEQGERRQIIEAARKDIVAQLTLEQKKKLREIMESDKSKSKT
jgi:Spy/CpxP family protein refolding chaperone